MYSYIRGKIVEISSNFIVVDNGNIGYEVFVANPYRYKLDEELLVYIYQKVAEDDITLYGFRTSEEKNMFLDLISVKGIGAKTSLVILEVTSIESLKEAIVNKDVEYLIKFPKVGKKSANQIILDLENKYKDDVGNIEKNNSKIIDDEYEVLEAMHSLGYETNKVKKLLSKVDSELSTEEKIKECLKLLIKI